jgi:sorting and assembly machinery component 37
MAMCVPPEAFEVVTSNNTDLSPSGSLPTLKHQEGQVDGYLDIIRYLNAQGYSLENRLNKEHSAINEGLILYVQDRFQLITDYTLFLNKDNYEKYTRGLYSRYLPFPMQYNTAIASRSKAKLSCGRAGLKVEDKTEVEEEMMKNVPSVSKVQKMNYESMIEDKLTLRNSVTNMSCIKEIQSSLEKVVQLKKELGGESIYLFGDSVTSSDLIIMAHLYGWTHKDLPDQFISTYLIRCFPHWLNILQRTMSQVEPLLENIQIRGPMFWESPNLFNSVRHLLI